METFAKFLVIAPGKEPEAVTDVLTLERMQNIVGGYIEAIYPFEDEAALICNEEGKLIGLKPNRALHDYAGNVYDIVFGTFMIVGLTDEDFGGLSDSQIMRYSLMFRNPETFDYYGDHVEPAAGYSQETIF